MTSLFLIYCLFFIAGYTLNMFYISVLYHRGLTHEAVKLKPFMLRWLGWTGVWVTGLDPKAWACMHRLHHHHSDTELDPHSPHRWGVLGVWKAQYLSYREIQRRLTQNEPELKRLVGDIPFPVSPVSQPKYSWLPYILHVLVALGINFIFDHWAPGLFWFLGIMSHPVQGWMVNALAHRYGRRNFETDDNSTNNTLVGIFVFGEGYQNNHHRFPTRAKFSVRWYELDAGYGLCWLAEKLGCLKILRN